MRVITTIDELRHQCKTSIARGERIGLIPTRGDLHDGHASLIRVAKAQCDLVICSIVRANGNPAVHENSDEYIAKESGANILWRPLPGPILKHARIQITPKSNQSLTAIATADAQLLALVQPSVVYIGEEHYQHARLLKEIINELLPHIELRTINAARTPEGVAIGNATRILDTDELEAAANIPAALSLIDESVKSGERSLYRLRARAEGFLASAGELLDIDDVETLDAITNEPVDTLDRDVLLVIRARVGDVALADSILIKS